PADVLLLRGADGAVPGDGCRAGARRHPRVAARLDGTTDDRAARGVPVRRARHRELRVVVADPHGAADHPGALERPAVAPQLALSGAQSLVPRRAQLGSSSTLPSGSSTSRSLSEP